MLWTPHVTVATVIHQDGRFLCVEEQTKADGSLVYNQPAGHVDPNETLIQAAIRETLEETAHQVNIDALLGIYTYTPRPEHTDTTETYYRFCFIASVVSHDPTLALDTGIEQALWLSLDEIRQSGKARSPLVIKCIEDFLMGKQLPLDAIFEHSWEQ